MKIIFTALRGPKKSRLIPQLETAPVGALSLEAVDMYERYLCEIDNQYLCVKYLPKNLGFKLLAGYSQEEVIGRNCRFLQGPDTDPEAVQKACLLHSYSFAN